LVLTASAVNCVVAEGRNFLEFFRPFHPDQAQNASQRTGGIAMKNLATKVQRFLKSEDGPTAVEYAVMLALIVIVCLTAIRSIGTNANTTFTNVAKELG
jgi:pilus assembly protein Flp/PilA